MIKMHIAIFELMCAFKVPYESQLYKHSQNGKCIFVYASMCIVYAKFVLIVLYVYVCQLILVSKEKKNETR